MATGYIQFPPQAALLPIADFPILKRHASSGTDLPEAWILEFADAEDNIAFFQFVVPGNYASAPVIKLYWMAVADTANDCAWEVSLMCATDDADDLDTAAADTSVDVDDTTASAAGEYSISVHTMTNNDSMTADDLAIIRVMRNGDDGNDDLTDPAQLLMVVFEYTTT